jgi:pimeloyl-ACP methyl ester carboxylesterase
MDADNSAKRVLFLLVLFLFLLSSACSRSGQLPLADLTRSPGHVIDLASCDTPGFNAKCLRLPVFEDRLAQKGRVININIVVVRATGSPVLPDPLFYFAGGPGGAGASSYGLASGMFAEINKHRDIVFFDQRGTGESNNLVCPEIKEGETAEGYLARCLQEVPGDPRFYTTALAMDDVDDIRQVLGYDQINLYGISYGVTAAQVYMNRHPEHVRSAILDHGTLLQVPFNSVLPRNSQLVLDKVFNRCQADPACHAAYPDLGDEFASLLVSLQQHVRTGQFDPATSQAVVLDRSAFNATIHYMLKSAERSALLPYLIHRAAQGDWDPLAAKYLQFIQQNPSQRVVLMSQIIWCYEDWAVGAPDGIASLGQGSYYLDTALETQKSQDENCRLYPDPGESAHHGPALPSDIPVLLFSGDSDPQNPPENVAGYQEIWPNSLNVVQAGISHEAPTTQCLNAIMAAFVETASVKDLPLACLDQYKLPAFKLK